MASREDKEPLRTIFMLLCSLLSLPKGNKSKGEHEDTENDSSDRIWIPLGLVACLKGRTWVFAKGKIYRGDIHQGQGEWGHGALTP